MTNNNMTLSNTAEAAINHTDLMDELYAEDIIMSMARTKMYNTDFVCKKETIRREMAMWLMPTDTVSAIAQCHNLGKTAVLNFASYTNPGGGFLNGSIAQEECLCKESFLYNVIEKHRAFYRWNSKHMNHGLYENRALYSPDIMFERNGEKFYADVISCAAPCLNAMDKDHFDLYENHKALRSRIKFILDIAKENEVEVLILGAFGCGVFGQDPKEVAGIFASYLMMNEYSCFKNVYFAIPDKNSENYIGFSEWNK